MIFNRDALGNVICNIRTPVSGSEIVGTAIFINKGDQEAYLLTATHVVLSITDESYAIISDSRGIPAKILLSELLGGAKFEHHPVADISKAKINITQKNIIFLSGRCFPFDQIDLTDNLISKDLEITTIGFPLGLGAIGAKFTPLSYRTYVSSPLITLNRFDTGTPCDFIIMESPSTGGYSGGPVFDLGYHISGGMTTTKEHTILHGLVHGTISDPTGGKMGAVTPTKYLKDWL